MNLPQNLKKNLVRIQVISIFNRFFRDSFRYLAALFAGLGIILIIEHIFDFPQALRQSIVATLPYALFIPPIFILLYKLRGLFDYQRSAVQIERDSGSFDGYLVSAVEIGRAHG